MQVLIYQATANCPDGWETLPTSESKCYRQSPRTDKLNFQDAMTKCGDENAILAEPRTDEENQAFATAFNSKVRYWIGITDQEIEGTFKYVSDDTEIGFESFSPKSRKAKHDCVSFRNGKWDTFHCIKKKLPYICQMEMETCPTGFFGFPECDNGRSF